MADKKGRSARGTIVTIIVLAAVIIAGWWIFAEWSSQPPATMPATGQAPVQAPSEGAPMMKGDPAQGRMEGMEGDIRDTAE